MTTLLVFAIMLVLGACLQKKVTSMDTKNFPPTAAKAGAIHDGDYKSIYLAGGCFWGVEQYFALVPGVVDAVSATKRFVLVLLATQKQCGLHTTRAR